MIRLAVCIPKLNRSHQYKVAQWPEKMQIVGAFAEFERAMLPERASNRLNAVRKEEHIDERRPKLHAHQENEGQ